MTQNDWYQQTLTPPEVVEVRIRLGLVPETDHLQCMVEMFDPMTSVLKASASIPHMHLANWQEALRWASDKADAWLQNELDPF